MNLINETLELLKANGLTAGAYSVTWEDFAKFGDVEYYSSFGSVEIARDLVVVGDGWWLERHEYDGSEWWEYKELPVRLIESKPFTQIKDTTTYSSGTIEQFEKRQEQKATE